MKCPELVSPVLSSPNQHHDVSDPTPWMMLPPCAWMRLLAVSVMLYNGNMLVVAPCPDHQHLLCRSIHLQGIVTIFATVCVRSHVQDQRLLLGGCCRSIEEKFCGRHKSCTYTTGRDHRAPSAAHDHVPRDVVILLCRRGVCQKAGSVNSIKRKHLLSRSMWLEQSCEVLRGRQLYASITKHRLATLG